MTSYTVKQPLDNLVLSNSIRLATIGLTKSLALELGKDGIRFFTQVKSVTTTWFDAEELKREKIDTWDGMLGR